MSRKKKVTTDAVEILHRRFIKGDRQKLRELEKIRQDLDIAEQIYKLRTSARLSQKQLAELVGTSQSAVSRLEDADYEGYSVKMLQKIAAAVHCGLKVQFIPNKKRFAHAS